jgi:hypothetical protein
MTRPCTPVHRQKHIHNAPIKFRACSSSKNGTTFGWNTPRVIDVYAKFVPAAQTILLPDTGCGGRTNNLSIELKDLRTFIETNWVGKHRGTEPLPV